MTPCGCVQSPDRLPLVMLHRMAMGERPHWGCRADIGSEEAGSFSPDLRVRARRPGSRAEAVGCLTTWKLTVTGSPRYGREAFGTGERPDTSQGGERTQAPGPATIDTTGSAAHPCP